MGPIDYIIIGVIVIIIGGAIAYIVKKKKSGAKCIGCPFAGECGKKSDKDNKCACGREGEREDSCKTEK